MKLIALLLLSTLMFSCKKEDQDIHYAIKATAQINSEPPFSLNFTESHSKFNREVIDNKISIGINGSKKDEYIFVLSVPVAAIGTFKLTNAAPAPAGIYYYGPNLLQPLKFHYASDNSIGSNIGSGNITIESLTNTTIKGKFNAVIFETVTGDKLTITDGSFEGNFN